MRIITHSTIVKFYEKHADSKDSLEAWYTIAEEAHWATPQEVKSIFGNASIIGDNRVVFNIKGNNYRLVVHIRYDLQRIYIKWIGTHAEYDKIDAETIGR